MYSYLSKLVCIAVHITCIHKHSNIHTYRKLYIHKFVCHRKWLWAMKKKNVERKKKWNIKPIDIIKLKYFSSFTIHTAKYMYISIARVYCNSWFSVATLMLFLFFPLFLSRFQCRFEWIEKFVRICCYIVSYERKWARNLPGPYWEIGRWKETEKKMHSHYFTGRVRKGNQRKRAQMMKKVKMQKKSPHLYTDITVVVWMGRRRKSTKKYTEQTSNTDWSLISERASSVYSPVMDEIHQTNRENKVVNITHSIHTHTKTYIHSFIHLFSCTNQRRVHL